MRIASRQLLWGWSIALVVAASPVIAQAGVPFISPGVTAFEPQISVVNSGALQDVQGTVSADRKYVTITARPQNSQLLQLRNFSFQTGGGVGVVGGVAPGATAPAAQGVINPPVVLG